MPIQYVDDYEIEYTAESLPGCQQWGAFVAIYAPSDNPMHLNNFYPRQRVAADLKLDSEAAAEQAASEAGLKILAQLRAPAQNL